MHYATVDGKPVVCLWGTAVSGRPDRVVDYQEMLISSIRGDVM